MMETNPLAFGLVIGTKLCIYYTAMVYYVPGGTLTHVYTLQVPREASRDVCDVCDVHVHVVLAYCTCASSHNGLTAE